MQLQLATPADIPVILPFIDQAKAFLKQQGIDQWQDGYPDLACIQEDITRGVGYLCVEEQRAVGYLCIDFDGEPAYDTLNGSWLSTGSYAVVHRMALDDAAKGRGLASQALRLAEELIRQRGVHSFKVDTDRDNQIMQHLLHKHGFQYCGTVLFDRSEKIAYEKLI